jgi:uncharacterized repeat protein (TIGR02543 family)
MYRRKTITPEDSRSRILDLCGVITLTGLLFSSCPAWAAPVTADTATGAVQGWLRQDRRPLGSHLSPRVKRAEPVKDATGAVRNYVMHLAPSGFVILSTDDTVDPIVAFSASGDFDAASGSTLAVMVNKDLPRRMARARAGAPAVGAAQARGKWHAFLAGSANPPPDVEENGNIVVASQIWVAPLVQTLWNQSDDVSGTVACFNYFTPPGAAGNTNNDPCGCIATALAQEMYYFQFPTAGVGIMSFIITNNGFPNTASLLGGDGAGGPYQWTNMPLSPNKPTVAQAMAIGYLTHDAGVAVNMDYTPTNSAATTYAAEQALTRTFMFASVGYYENDSGMSSATLLNMINPCLDAHLPVILGIAPDGGHCLLCDGYGYSSSTLFYHLNTGWGGADDVWYALPGVDTPDNGDFTIVNACIYNIYTNGGGQIISGRVTDPTGAPVAGAAITAAGGGGPYAAMTDANGVYALAHVPAASTYTLTATKGGNSSGTNMCATGTSDFNQLPSGNVWGENFILSPTLLAIPETGFASIGPSNGPFSVQSKIYDLTNTSASPVNWTISNTNNWLSVTPTNGAAAAGAISVMTVSLNSAAGSLGGGTYSGSIWITNLGNGLAQQLQFSLSVAAADYPIAVTGYNLDVVVESNASGGNTYNYANTFDPYCDFLIPTSPVCFYEAGLAAGELLASGSAVVLGLPAGGLVTNEFDHATTFQFGPYDGGNVLCLTHDAPSGSLTLGAPAACSSLSVLAASVQGGGNGALVLHFTDGTTSPNIAFNAANYLTTNTPGSGAALTNFGLLITGDYVEFGSVDDNTFFPTLYQTSTNLHAAGLDSKLISSVTFTMPSSTNTNAATGIFALSGTQALYAGDYLLSATASPANGGTISGGGELPAGGTNTLTATANANYLFDNWTQNGFVVGTSSNYTLTLNGNETLVANFLTHYTVTVIASPAGGGTVSGGGTNLLQGSIEALTATANSGYEFIGWTGDATGTSSTLMVTVNTNLTITANFASNGANISLSVITNVPSYGTVTVSPKLNGGVLNPGRNYTLTATAKSGDVFSNWTGSITTNKNPLSFKAEANMVLEANFIPNPFLPLKGTYNGLFSESNGVTEATAGMLKGLTISQKGTYSGALLINGASHAVSGTFNLGCQATNHISRTTAQGGPLTVAMTASANESAPQVTGTVAGTNFGTAWVANLTADRATNTVPSAEYTLLLPPDANNSPPANSPGGDGYALIANSAGTARITGALADGAALSQTASVSEDGYVPIYASLYSGKGLLLGWINLELTNTDGVGLTWIHPGTRSGLYTNGFMNVLSADQILLSQWTNPGSFESLTNLSMLDAIGSSGVLTNIDISITDSGKMTGPSGASVSGSITPKTGLFTVTIGSGATKVTGHGAMLNATNGGGYFVTKTNAQSIQLGP